MTVIPDSYREIWSRTYGPEPVLQVMADYDTNRITIKHPESLTGLQAAQLAKMLMDSIQYIREETE